MRDDPLDGEEKVTSLFQVDTLISAQFAETFRRKSPLEPEKKLMLAILEDALKCFQSHALMKDHRGKILFRETEEWILEEDSDQFFSFNNICEVVGFNPDYIRPGLMKWKDQKLREPFLVKGYRKNGKPKQRRDTPRPFQKKQPEPDQLLAVTQ